MYAGAASWSTSWEPIAVLRDHVVLVFRLRQPHSRHEFPPVGYQPISLGMGEGGGFPAATRAVAEWFPTKERATAMGIINAGTAVGAVVAPPLIAAVLGYTNWRWIFVLTGGLGLLWAAA
jgi:MFS family permease